jgi:hypothetical protein
MRAFTPSELTMLHGDQFADQKPSSDSSVEKPICGNRRVNALRLSVAMVVSALIASVTAGNSSLEYRQDQEMTDTFQQLEALSGGKLVGGVLKSFGAVQNALNAPKPHLMMVSDGFAWPESSLEAHLERARGSEGRPVSRIVQVVFEPHRAASSLLRAVKTDLKAHDLLEQRRGGLFGLGSEWGLTEAGQRALEASKPMLEALLHAKRSEYAQVWTDLDRVVSTVFSSDS